MKSFYSFADLYVTKNLEEIWATISIDLREKKIDKINSITGVLYKIDEVTNVSVSYSAPTRNKGKKEELAKEDFINFLTVLKEHQVFNTSTIKLELPPEIYKKRSPLFAILLSLEIITKKIK